MIAQRVGDQKRGERFRQPRHVLCHVDERHRQIAGGVQDRHAERAHQHDLSGRGLSVLPQHQRPGHQRDGEHHGDHRVKQPHLLQIQQAAPPRAHLAPDRSVEPAVFALEAAEGPYQGHVADDVDHLAVDRRGLVGKIVMQRLAGGGEAEHRQDENGRDQHQPRGHLPAHGGEEHDRPGGRHTRRQHVPDEHVLHREHGVGGRRDAAREHSGQALGEVAGRMSG